VGLFIKPDERIYEKLEVTNNSHNFIKMFTR